MVAPIREWEDGAKRDTDLDKLDFEGVLSPLVLRRFTQYMMKHTKMSDGSPRTTDNWQKGFGDFATHMKTCMKSLWRHFFDVWLHHRGWETTVDLDEALCGVMFNAMAMLHKLLEAREGFSKQEYFDMLKRIKENENE